MLNEPLELSIVIPAHNEARSLRLLVLETETVLRSTGLQFEIIIVDDGSSDGTPGLRFEGITSPVRLLRHERQAGQSAALRTGVRAARACIVATMDGDGQNDPADIPVLLAYVQKSNTWAMACGNRIGRRDDGFRKFSSRVASLARRWVLKDEIPDSGCGIKVFHKELFLNLPYFNHMHRFLPSLAKREGAAVSSFPICHRPRQAGKSHYGILNRLGVGMVDIVGVWWLLRRQARAGRVTEIVVHDG